MRCQKLDLRSKYVYKTIQTHSSLCSIIVLSRAFSKIINSSSCSISPHHDFFGWSREANPLKLLESGFYFSLSEIAFQFTCRLRQPFRRHTCCLSLDFAFWSEGPLTKAGKKRLKKRERQEKRSLSNALHRTMNFPPPFKCISRMLEWFITADSEVWQWTSEMSDAIFLLISFPWSSLSLWPVYLY